MTAESSATSATPLFRDRREAGLRLAGRLHHLAGTEPLVLGLSGGGLVVAVVVADALGAGADIVNVHSGDSTRHRLEATSRMRANLRETGFLNAAGGSAMAAQAAADAELAGLEERHAGHAEMPEVLGRTVVLVDDGLHPDTEVHAALRALRLGGAIYVVLATPFLTRASADLHDSETDEIVALAIPDEYGAATEFYADPTPPELPEVQALLGRLRRSS